MIVLRLLVTVPFQVFIIIRLSNSHLADPQLTVSLHPLRPAGQAAIMVHDGLISLGLAQTPLCLGPE